MKKEMEVELERLRAENRSLSIQLLGEVIGNRILSGLTSESEVSRINRLGRNEIIGGTR
jgi:hypothetical protein